MTVHTYITYDGREIPDEPQYVIEDGFLMFGPFPTLALACTWAQEREAAIRASELELVGFAPMSRFTIRTMRYPGKVA